jgi:endonuclease/exonuclease/phosphatase family metal-dependent hydrolase
MTIKIISLNIWHGKLLARVVEFLRAGKADIVLLQEVYNGDIGHHDSQYRTFQTLQKELGYEYSAFGQAYEEKIGSGDLIPHGNAIFSRWPIQSSQVILMTESTLDYYQEIPEHWPILPAPLQHAVIDAASVELDVFNIHGVWDLDGDNFSDRRRQMSDAIFSSIQDKPNVILAGDSNAKPTNRAMKNLETVLRPVFGAEIKTSFNMRRKDNPGYATAAVDVMYVSPNIEIASKEVPDVDVSDHLPLVVTLRIN